MLKIISIAIIISIVSVAMIAIIISIASVAMGEGEDVRLDLEDENISSIREDEKLRIAEAGFVVFQEYDNDEIFRVLMPEGYPETELTTSNVFITFPDMYGKYSIEEIKSALRQKRR